jgi:aspartyl protease family protein
MSTTERTDTRRMGKVMMLGAWIVLLGLLYFLFQSVIEGQNNPNQAPVSSLGDNGVRQVMLKRNRAGHYIANGFINRFPVTFLLDTGATDVAVPEQLAKQIGLKPGMPLASRTANGIVTSWQTRIDEVRLGNIALKNVSASILPTMQGGQVLLGMSFLKKLELIQRGNELTLRQY